MNELLVEKIGTKEKVNLMSSNRRQTKITTRINARGPACSACELPILSVLSRSPETGTETRLVLEEVITKWFSQLDDDDRNSRYPASKRKIVESVIKYARKNLVLKGEIFPAGEGKPVGIWRATPRGLERVLKERGGWSPRYTNHDAVIIEDRS